MTAALQDTYSKKLMLGDTAETTIDSVSSMAFSASGDFLLSGSDGGKVYIWDVNNGKSVYSTDVQSSVTSVLWNPMSNMSFFFGTRAGAYIVDDYRASASSGHSILLGLKGTVYALAFDLTNQHLAVGIAEEVHLSRMLDNLDAFTSVVVFPAPSRLSESSQVQETRIRARSLHFSNKGRNLIVSYLAHGVICWDVKSRQQVWKITPAPQNRLIAYSVLSPNGRYILLSNLRYGMDLYEFGVSKVVRSYKQKGYNPGNNFPLTPSFLHGGRLVTCGSNVGDVQLWNTASGESDESLFHDRRVQVVSAWEGYVDRFIATACIEDEGNTVITIWRARRGQHIYRAISDFIVTAKLEHWLGLALGLILVYVISVCSRQPTRGQAYSEFKLLMRHITAGSTELFASLNERKEGMLRALRQYIMKSAAYILEQVALPRQEERDL